MSKATDDERMSKATKLKAVAAPVLPYRPQATRGYNPPIGLIGCGGITVEHLTAYRNGGYNVTALCDVDQTKAERRRKKFYPDAKVYTDYRAVLDDPSIEVVDVATHPKERVQIVEDALNSGNHVLSQKPFALDLDVAENLANLADSRGLRLAVNQNGRWAPYFSYMRLAVKEGLIGDVFNVDFSVHWDHNWVKDTVFNDIHHLILYDFAIHWFDMAVTFFGGAPATRVYASLRHSPSQQATPPMLANAIAEFDTGAVTFDFNADCPYGQREQTVVVGSKGTMRSDGDVLVDQMVALYTEKGRAAPELEGRWFPDGFQGAMAELLCAIEDGREPGHSGRNNLNSLALCFAAVASSEQGVPCVPGEVRKLPVSTPANG